jgi:hypothetical protein
MYGCIFINSLLTASVVFKIKSYTGHYTVLSANA